MPEWLLSGHNTLESLTTSPPFTASLFEIGINGAVDAFVGEMLAGIFDVEDSLPAAVVIQGRVYLNVNYSVQNAAFPFDPGSIGVPQEFIKEHPEYVVEKSQIPPYRLPKVLGRFRELYRWARNFYRYELPVLQEEHQQFYWQLRKLPDEEELLWKVFSKEYKQALYDSGRAHEIVSIALVVVESIIYQKAPQLLNLLAGQETITSLLAQRVWELREIAVACGEEVTRRLREGVTDPEVYQRLPAAEPLMKGISDFLHDYGHRGFRHEFDPATERLADHPQQILLAVAGQLLEDSNPKKRARAAYQAGEAALQQIKWPQRAIWRRLLRWSQQLISWREQTKSFMTLEQSIIGLSIQGLSRRFYPDEPDDLLLFYNYKEFERLTDSGGVERVPMDVLNRRRAEYELHLSQPPPPQTLWYNPETGHWRAAIASSDEGMASQAQAASEPLRFEGIGASSGTGPVEGLAIVTNDPYEAGRRLLKSPNEVILVTELTDPAWSSLFVRLTGVVTELGGVLSHAAIVARENGLPAVVSVPEATKRIRDGQRLRIDGALGVVELID